MNSKGLMVRRPAMPNRHHQSGFREEHLWLNMLQSALKWLLTPSASPSGGWAPQLCWSSVLSSLGNIREDSHAHRFDGAGGCLSRPHFFGLTWGVSSFFWDALPRTGFPEASRPVWGHLKCDREGSLVGFKAGWSLKAGKRSDLNIIYIYIRCLEAKPQARV